MQGLQALVNSPKGEVNTARGVELNIVDAGLQLGDPPAIALELFLQGGALGAPLLLVLVKRFQSPGE